MCNWKSSLGLAKMTILIAEITPNTKPRMTQSDKWKKRPCVMQYRAFCDDLRWQAQIQRFDLSGSFKICFYFEMPAKWSDRKKSQMLGKPHQLTPDLDNLLKAVNDVLLEQDKIIYKINACKIWGKTGKIVIENF